MKILVTGATGFVGRHLMPKLINERHEILELTIEPEVSEKLYGDKTQKYLIDDNQSELTDKIENFNPEIIIHLASFLTSLDDYNTQKKLLNTNILFLCRILDAIKNTNLKLFINTGTFAEYYKGDGVFDPAYLYSATKTASRSFLDYYSKVYNFNYVTVVPYTIYGGNDSQKKIIDIIYESLDSQQSTDLSPGEQQLDFIHVEDITDFYIHLIKNIENLEYKSNFQVGTGLGISLRELTKIIEDQTNKTANINWGGKPYRSSDVMYAVANLSNSRGWKPKIHIKEGIKKYIQQRILQ
jgi:nucleoside-diphosphate-sugar epimerase